MNKSTKGALIVIGVAIVLLGVWAVVSMNKQSAQNEVSHDSSSDSHSDAEVGATITYTSDGFSPSNFTVKSGQKVKVINNSNQMIEFASDPHPTHTINPEMNSGDMEAGSTKEIVVTRTGEWGFHNHFNPSKRGTMTVE